MSSIIIPVTPGQIYIKRGTTASFAEIVHINPNGMYHVHVMFRPIIEDRDAAIETCDETIFLNDYALCFDLYSHLLESFERNPNFVPVQPNDVKLHQIWSPIDNRKQFYRITYNSYEKQDVVGVQRIIHKFTPKRELKDKEEIKRNFVYLTSVIDMVKAFREGVIRLKMKMKESGDA